MPTLATGLAFSVPLSGLPVVPDIQGGYRDASNVRRDIRAARDKDALAWITSHSFRKTTATILDDAAQSPQQVADQLGHARQSMTQDVYVAGTLSTRPPPRRWTSRYATGEMRRKAWQCHGASSFVRHQGL